jgi:hypothetical protein
VDVRVRSVGVGRVGVCILIDGVRGRNIMNLNPMSHGTGDATIFYKKFIMNR